MFESRRGHHMWRLEMMFTKRRLEQEWFYSRKVLALGALNYWWISRRTIHYTDFMPHWRHSKTRTTWINIIKAPPQFPTLLYDGSGPSDVFLLLLQKGGSQYGVWIAKQMCHIMILFRKCSTIKDKSNQQFDVFFIFWIILIFFWRESSPKKPIRFVTLIHC